MTAARHVHASPGARKRRFALFLILAAAVAGVAVGVALAGTTRPAATHQLVIGVNAIPITLDNDFVPGQESAEAVINNYDPLYTWLNKPDSQGIPSADIAAGEAGTVGALVQKATVSSDGRTWTLHLREGVKSAAGNEMTSADVKWTFDRAFATKAIGVYIMAVAGVPSPASVTVVDKYTVKIHLSGPNGIFRQVMFVHPARIVDSTLAKQHVKNSDPWATTWLKTNSAGFGPYNVTQFTSGQQAVFTANPNYWGKKPYFTTVIQRAIPDSSQRLLLLEQGQIDIAEGLSTQELAALKGKKNVRVISTVKNQFLYAALSTAKGPTANPLVRQALQYAVPQNDLNRIIYQGAGKPLRNVMPDSYAGFDAAAWHYSYNLAKAKALLAKAGYAKGFTTSIDVNADIPEHTSAAIILANAFKKIGVKLNIDKKPSAAYFTAAASGNYGAVMAGSYAVVDEVCYHYSTFVSGSGPVSFTNFKNSVYDALIAKCNRLPAGAARTAVGKQLQVVVDQQVPTLSLLETPTTYGVKSTIKGYSWSTYNQLRFDALSSK